MVRGRSGIGPGSRSGFLNDFNTRSGVLGSKRKLKIIEISEASKSDV